MLTTLVNVQIENEMRKEAQDAEWSIHASKEVCT